MNFKIKHIDNVQGTIEIDWLNGVTLIHSIPLYILENPDLPQERMIQELEYMRPPAPEPIEIPGALLDLVEEPEPEPDPEPEPQYKTQFSVLEFRDRFTIDEQLAIRQAQFDDMEVGLVYDSFQAAQFIDIEDPRVEQGIDLYIAKGLLAPGRKGALLEPETVEPEHT